MRPASLFAALSIALAPVATAAEDVSLFNLFRTICADADPARGEARALAQGFTPSKKRARSPGLEEAKGFEKDIGERRYFAIVGRGKGRPRDGMPASATSACGVGYRGKDEAAMAAGRRWVGVPASRTVMGVGFHGFRQAGGARTALSFEDKPALKAALAAGDFNVLTISGLGGVTLLMLTKTREAS